MKLPQFLKNTEPRPFHYTPVFNKDEKTPIKERLEQQEDAKFRFERKAQQRSFLPANAIRLLFPLLLLAAIAYFCLIIFGKQ